MLGCLFMFVYRSGRRFRGFEMRCVKKVLGFLG